MHICLHVHIDAHKNTQVQIVTCKCLECWSMISLRPNEYANAHTRLQPCTKSDIHRSTSYNMNHFL